MSQQLSVLTAYAHPDDEQGVSGLLAKYSRQGVATTLVCATRGEVGEIAPGVDATSETLGQVRERELRRAVEMIGVENLYLLDYRDSGMAGSPENNDARNFHQADLFEVAGKLVRIIRMHKPQVVITFDAFGGYGHPDHIKMHQAALMAYFVAGDARAYTEQLEDGLEPWAPFKLYFNAFTRSRWEAFAQYAEEQGIQLEDWFHEFRKRAIPDELVSARIDVSEFVDLKWDALNAHASQMNPNSPFAKVPLHVRKQAMNTEALICAESRVGRMQGVEHDIFSGIN